jgi:hydroxyacylglutathione hydrolase
MLHIEPVKAFADNYLWVFHQLGSQDAAVVDPGDAAPVQAYLQQQDLRLTAILLTHHHADHIGGVNELRQQWQVPVYGPPSAKIPQVTRPVHEGSELVVCGVNFRVLTVPGHTLEHIAYFAANAEDSLSTAESSPFNAEGYLSTAKGSLSTAENADGSLSTVEGSLSNAEGSPLVFCGDTLFAAGCGRMFEGTAPVMYASLQKLAGLPRSTRVYCTHEYTLSNLKFADAVLADSAALSLRIEAEQRKRQRDLATLPSTIELELATNPFLRCEDPAVVAALARQGTHTSEPAQVFGALRRWKDSF